jgi:hypothetical protein
MIEFISCVKPRLCYKCCHLPRTDSISHYCYASMICFIQSFVWYRGCQRFWPLKCVNCNLRASHQKIAGRGGKRTDLIAFFLFLHSFGGLHIGLSHQGQQPKMVEATKQLAELYVHSPSRQKCSS